MKRYDILVAGELNPDLILSGSDVTPRFGQGEILVEKAALTIGSSAAIFATASAKLGLQVGFVGVVGNDHFGQFMLEGLQNRGVQVSPVVVDDALQTGLSVILSRGNDRAILTYSGAISKLRAEQITDNLLTQSKHLHIASYFLQTDLKPGLPDLLRRAKSHGLTTSLDTNWDPQETWGPELSAAYPQIDVLLPNTQEAMFLGRAKDWREGARALSAQGPTVIVKRGAEGAVAVTGDRLVEADAIRTEVVDTTGAGDNFDAGFMYGYLAGWPLLSSLKVAVACGSLSTQAVGGTGHQADLEEALRAAGLDRERLR
jgi:sugar/nucleoside kinase (ribokinase family)